MKKILTIMTTVTMLLAGCSGGGFKAADPINVVSREEGSGTRGAFVELFGIEEKDANGEKIDRTTLEADVTNNTAVMMTTVSSDKNAIGYISLGSLNDTVKAVSIDGVAVSVDAIKDGSYKAARPFLVVTKGDVNKETADFLTYIQSAEGQAVVESAGYIAGAASPASYTAAEGLSGTVVVAGSSSVTPVMEKLKEAYAVLVPTVKIEVQQSDSTTGINDVVNEICNIGMASRALKDSEVEKGLTPITLAMDGIAVIVNEENPTTNLTSEQVKSIYVGDQLTWELQ